MMSLALAKHNEIREKHIDTGPLTLAEDLVSDAQDYADQLRRVLIDVPDNIDQLRVPEGWSIFLKLIFI